MRGWIVLAVGLVITGAFAGDHIVPTSERQLDQRIALFQQEARLAPCDAKDRICAMGRNKWAWEGVRLAVFFPTCTDKNCEARKSNRQKAAMALSLQFAAPATPKDLYVERQKTNTNPPMDEALDYVEGVKKALATTSCPETEKICIAGRIAYLVEIDQLMRFLAVDCERVGSEKGPEARRSCYIKTGPHITEVDALGRSEMEHIIDRFGWPDTVHWGDGVQNDAWLLAQHADEDVALQKKFYTSIKTSYEAGNTPGMSYAYIADRVASHDGTPQLYGTQGRCYGEGPTRVWKPNMIADEANIEARRATAKLNSYSQYRQTMNGICQGKL